ncbi:hypothetical protein HT031_004661 [Scenedesmus sp. PABB004]|nr:hypothetical protein HT031_004661 [Scenedesmus sp. PABB004]
MARTWDRSRSRSRSRQRGSSSGRRKRSRTHSGSPRRSPARPAARPAGKRQRNYRKATQSEADAAQRAPDAVQLEEEALTRIAAAVAERYAAAVAGGRARGSRTQAPPREPSPAVARASPAAAAGPTDRWPGPEVAARIQARLKEERGRLEGRLEAQLEEERQALLERKRKVRAEARRQQEELEKILEENRRRAVEAAQGGAAGGAAAAPARPAPRSGGGMILVE